MLFCRLTLLDIMWSIGLLWPCLFIASITKATEKNHTIMLPVIYALRGIHTDVFTKVIIKKSAESLHCTCNQSAAGLIRIDQTNCKYNATTVYVILTLSLSPLSSDISESASESSESTYIFLQE